MIDKTEITFIEQAKLQGRVIWALTMREIITRFGREGLGAFWLLAEPAMFIIGVMVIFSYVETPATYSIAEYLAISYPTLLLWRNGTNRVVKSIEVNRALLHHQPIKCIDLIYSRILLEFSSATAAFTILYIIFWQIGICRKPHNLLTFILGYLLVVWFSFGFILVMTALSDLSETIERLSHIIMYLMLPFTGVFLPLFAVPMPYRDMLLWFPLIDAIEIMHHGYYGLRMQTYFDVQYTILSLSALTLAGYALTNISVRRLLSK